jgi:hypothetical protein
MKVFAHRTSQVLSLLFHCTAHIVLSPVVTPPYSLFLPSALPTQRHSQQCNSTLTNCTHKAVHKTPAAARGAAHTATCCVRGTTRVQISVWRPDQLQGRRLPRFSSVPTGRCWDSTSNDTRTASFHIPFSPLFIIVPTDVTLSQVPTTSLNRSQQTRANARCSS